MAKKNPNQSTRSVAKRGVGYAKLVKTISQVNTGMVARAAVAVNQALVLRNWLIGCLHCRVRAERGGPGEVWHTAARDSGARSGYKRGQKSWLHDPENVSALFPNLPVNWSNGG